MKTKLDLPAWIPPQIWQDYEEMRKLIKRPMTDRARKIAITRLDQFRTEGYDPVEVLEEAILNSWQGIWRPKHVQPKRFEPGYFPQSPEDIQEVNRLRAKLGIKDWII